MKKPVGRRQIQQKLEDIYSLFGVELNISLNGGSSLIGLLLRVIMPVISLLVFVAIAVLISTAFQSLPNRLQTDAAVALGIGLGVMIFGNLIYHCVAAFRARLQTRRDAGLKPMPLLVLLQFFGAFLILLAIAVVICIITPT